MHEYSQFLPVRNDADRLDVISLLSHVFSTQQKRELFSFNEQNWQAGVVKQKVAKAQAFFKKKGLKQGDSVAIMLDNSPEHVFFVYAMMLAGIIWVPVNTRFKYNSIKYVLENSNT